MEAKDFVKALAEESEKVPKERRASQVDIAAWTGTNFEPPPFSKTSLTKPRVVFQRKGASSHGVRVRAARPPTSNTPPAGVHNKAVGTMLRANLKCNRPYIGLVNDQGLEETSRSGAERLRVQTPTGVRPSRSVYEAPPRRLSDLCRQSTEVRERLFQPRKSVHIPRAVANSPITEFLARTKLTASEVPKSRYSMRKRETDWAGTWFHSKTFFV